MNNENHRGSDALICWATAAGGNNSINPCAMNARASRIQTGPVPASVDEPVRMPPRFSEPTHAAKASSTLRDGAGPGQAH